MAREPAGPNARGSLPGTIRALTYSSERDEELPETSEHSNMTQLIPERDRSVCWPGRTLERRRIGGGHHGNTVGAAAVGMTTDSWQVLKAEPVGFPDGPGTRWEVRNQE